MFTNSVDDYIRFSRFNSFDAINILGQLNYSLDAENIEKLLRFRNNDLIIIPRMNRDRFIRDRQGESIETIRRFDQVVTERMDSLVFGIRIAIPEGLELADS